MFVNRRRTMRIPCDCMAVWTYPTVGCGSVRNMSVDGLFLAGPYGATSGDHLDVAVMIGDDIVAFSADVRFVGETRHGFGRGARIVDISDADRDRWRRAYWQRIENAAARVPTSIGHHLFRRGDHP